jgi:hypothetical protein
MKTKDSYLPLFFLCWAFLYSPFALLSVFPLEENKELVGLNNIRSEAAIVRQVGFFCEECQNHTQLIEQRNHSTVPFFYRYKQSTYELK